MNFMSTKSSLVSFLTGFSSIFAIMYATPFNLSLNTLDSSCLMVVFKQLVRQVDFQLPDSLLWLERQLMNR